jgi:predicted oxidoreductase (fatty acid repression mutant protein)
MSKSNRTTTVRLSEKAQKIKDALKETHTSFNFSELVSRLIVDEYEEEDVKKQIVKQRIREAREEAEEARAREEALKRKLKNL